MQICGIVSFFDRQNVQAYHYHYNNIMLGHHSIIADHSIICSAGELWLS